MMLLFSAGTVIALLGLLWAEREGSVRGKWVAKPLASAGFIAVAVAGGAADSTYGRVLLVGFVLSWIGDVLLIPKDKRAFLAGLGSFLLGHVFFAAAFAVRGVASGWIIGAAFVLAIAASLVLRWLLPHVERKMLGPVIGYVVVITLMLACAVGGVAHGQWLALVGAFAFYLSDLAVARNRFVAPGFINRLWGLPLYYVAQLAFAWSVVVGASVAP